VVHLRLAIAACDLAEIISSAIALNLLFGIPLSLAFASPWLDVLIVLFLRTKASNYIVVQ
jgi:manganese transport protein